MSDINDFLNAPQTLLIPPDLPGASAVRGFDEDPLLVVASHIAICDLITEHPFEMAENFEFNDPVQSAPLAGADTEAVGTLLAGTTAEAKGIKAEMMRNIAQVIANSFGQSNPEVVDLSNHSNALGDAVWASTERYTVEGTDEDGDDVYSNLKIAQDGTLVCEIDANNVPFVDAPYFPTNGIYQIGNRTSTDVWLFCRVTEGVPSYAPFNSESLIDTTNDHNEFPIRNVFDASAYRKDGVKNYSIVISIYDSIEKSSILFPCFGEIWIDWTNGKILIMIGLMENRINRFPQTVSNDRKSQSPIILKAKISMVEALIAILIGNGIINADPAVVVSTVTSPKQLASLAKRRRSAAGMVHKIALRDLRYDKSRWIGRHLSANGVAWHCVRGHFRNLTSAQYTSKRGARVWVKPHTRGKKALGEINHIYTKG